LALFWHEGIAGNAQEGPAPISAGPISKSINANQPLTLEGIPAVAGLLPVQPPAKVPAAAAPTVPPPHQRLIVRIFEYMPWSASTLRFVVPSRTCGLS